MPVPAPSAAFVTETGKSGGRWKNVWVPVVPVNGEYHQQIVSLLKSGGGDYRECIDWAVQRLRDNEEDDDEEIVLLAASQRA